MNINTTLKTLILGTLFIFFSTPLLHAEEAPTSQRDRMFSLGGGKFNPADGESGTAFSGQFLSQNGQTRIGGEFEYRDFEATLFEVQNVETQSYTARVLGIYLLRPSGISPYIGAGLSLSVHVIDGDKIEQAHGPGTVVISDVGSGFGIIGFIGIEAPVTPALTIFAEGRLSGDYQFTKTENLNTAGEEELEVENLGGVGFLGGLRFRF